MSDNEKNENGEIKQESYEADLSTLTSKISSTWQGHRWIQQGPYLVCQSCELKHAVYIGMDKQLIGFDENNKPLFRKINPS